MLTPRQESECPRGPKAAEERLDFGSGFPELARQVIPATSRELPCPEPARVLAGSVSWPRSESPYPIAPVSAAPACLRQNRRVQDQPDSTWTADRLPGC